VARRLAAVLLAALALAGCGGSSKDSESTTTTESTAATQAAYANSLCGSLSTWKNSLTSVATTFRSGNLTQEKMKQSATTVSDANKRLADDLDTGGSAACTPVALIGHASAESVEPAWRRSTPSSLPPCFAILFA
jgi:outer membrane PBP1 activator LpoA protein